MVTGPAGVGKTTVLEGGELRVRLDWIGLYAQLGLAIHWRLPVDTVASQMAGVPTIADVDAALAGPPGP